MSNDTDDSFSQFSLEGLPEGKPGFSQERAAVRLDYRLECNFLSTVLETMDVLVIVLDQGGKVVRYNQACERLFGYSAEDIREKLTTGYLPLPEEIRVIKTFLRQIHSKERENHCENEWIDAAGNHRTIAWTISAHAAENDQVQYILATGIDITPRKRAENMLENERQLLQGLINSIPDLIFYKDLNGVYTGCNTAYERFSKKKASEIKGLNDIELSGRELGTRLIELDKQVLNAHKLQSYETWTRDPEGNQVLMETRKSPYYGTSGEVLGIIGICRDITKHRKVENTLRKANLEIEQLITSLSSILIVLNTQYQITQWNIAAQNTFGILRKEVIGRHLRSIEIGWDWTIIQENILRCEADMRPVYLDPVSFKRSDGKDGFLGINISPIYNEAKQLSGLIILAGDITDRKILETRLSHAQKLESIGQLAAGIAHEINTPIQFIGDNSTFLQSTYAQIILVLKGYEEFFNKVKNNTYTAGDISILEEKLENADLQFLCHEIPLAIQQSIDGIHRVAEIVNAMRDFSHPGVKEKTLVDINQAIQNTLMVSKNEWKYVADVITDLDENLPQVACLPSQINQVFLNIFVNAAHAIAARQEPEGKKGIIHVNTSFDLLYVEIRISDNGLGIPKEIHSKIFEPFFTTKTVGKGTGQGLAIAYDVVTNKHGGTLSFDTSQGEGTTFIVRLPIDINRQEANESGKKGAAAITNESNDIVR